MRATASSEGRRRLQIVLDDLWRQIVVPGASVALLTAEVHLSTPAGSLRVGRDRDGLPHLLVPLPGGPPAKQVLGTEGVSVEERVLLVAERPTRFLDLGCTRD